MERDEPRLEPAGPQPSAHWACAAVLRWLRLDEAEDHLDDARRGVVSRPPPGLVQGLRDEGPELGLLRAKVLDLETRLGRAERAIRDQSDLEGRLLRSETLLKKVCDTMVIDDVDW